MNTTEQQAIRVFARKTKWTPTDDLAFTEGPPLYDLPNLPVMISCSFTWDVGRAVYLLNLWKVRFHNVKIGGPAYDDYGHEFIPGRFVKQGVTITSRGCPKRCEYCLVRRREGKLREINIEPGHIVQDNNLLACSRRHVEGVFKMLSTQKKAVSFSGGLDIDYLKPWHIEWFKKLKIAKSGLWVACDRVQDIDRLDKARDLLSDFSIEKRRCYVLVGQPGDKMDWAAERCRSVLSKGFLPFAQLYRDIHATSSRANWRDFCYYWSSPKLYRKKEGIL